MIKRSSSNDARIKRHTRMRGKISGTPEVPRLNVFRSNSNIYAQIIDDVNGRTLVSASNIEKGFDDSGTKKDIAKKVGTVIAKKAADANIKHVVFDRGGYQYHGRVKELAEGAREGGLEF
ncbi:MAG: 50S ribosomal protein L18 [Oscillospiraceae bacterium]|nr:50S ribosomal protein L18 [Oscillospiraceae bacterium]